MRNYRYGLRLPFCFAEKDEEPIEATGKNKDSSQKASQNGANKKVKGVLNKVDPNKEIDNPDDIPGYSIKDQKLVDYLKYMTDSFIDAISNLTLNRDPKDRNLTKQYDEDYQKARKRYQAFYVFAKSHSKKKGQYNLEDYTRSCQVPSTWENDHKNTPTIAQPDVAKLIKVYRDLQLYDFSYTVHEGENRFIPQFNQLYFWWYYLALASFMIKNSDEKDAYARKLIFDNKNGSKVDHLNFQDIYNKIYDLLDRICKKTYGKSLKDKYHLEKLNIQGINSQENKNKDPIKLSETTTENNAKKDQKTPKGQENPDDKKKKNKSVDAKWYKLLQRKFKTFKDNLAKARKKDQGAVDKIYGADYYKELNNFFFKDGKPIPKAPEEMPASVNQLYMNIYSQKALHRAGEQISHFTGLPGGVQSVGMTVAARLKNSKAERALHKDYRDFRRVLQEDAIKECKDYFAKPENKAEADAYKESMDYPQHVWELVGLIVLFSHLTDSDDWLVIMKNFFAKQAKNKTEPNGRKIMFGADFSSEQSGTTDITQEPLKCLGFTGVPDGQSFVEKAYQYLFSPKDMKEWKTTVSYFLNEREINIILNLFRINEDCDQDTEECDNSLNIGRKMHDIADYLVEQITIDNCEGFKQYRKDIRHRIKFSDKTIAEEAYIIYGFLIEAYEDQKTIPFDNTFGDYDRTGDTFKKKLADDDRELKIWGGKRNE